MSSSAGDDSKENNLDEQDEIVPIDKYNADEVGASYQHFYFAKHIVWKL